MSDGLAKVFGEVDERIRRLEGTIGGQDSADLEATVDESLVLAKMMMRAHRADRAGRDPTADLSQSEDPLAVFRAFVKGDPSLNAVRDNLRELVYYRNCLDLRRLDALPPRADVMAVRTIRHIYLYLRGRLVQSHRLPE